MESCAFHAELRMNLFDMATRRDANLVLTAHAVVFPAAAKVPRNESASMIALTKRTIASRQFRGFHIVAAAEPARIRIKSILSFYPFSERRTRTDWRVLPLGTQASCKIRVALVRGTSTIAATAYELTNDATFEIAIPSTLNNIPEKDSVDLEISISNTGREGILFIDHEIMNRAKLVSGCTGVGVEIGPGTNPQIRPSADTDVIYVEQSSPEQWSELYIRGKEVDKSLWSNYRIGEAHQLPVEDGTLDFIFCSHVFEHLANPLGHLEYWKSKLRPGGKVVAVLPAVTGCKDYVFQPCAIQELLAEHAARRNRTGKS